jgi:hypothetical protein
MMPGQSTLTTVVVLFLMVIALMALLLLALLLTALLLTALLVIPLLLVAHEIVSIGLGKRNRHRLRLFQTMWSFFQLPPFRLKIINLSGADFARWL